MSRPTHNPDVCVWKAGRWECLHAVDADHFWLGDLLVDMPQLYHEANNTGRKHTTIQSHDLKCDLQYLDYVARCLIDPIDKKWPKVKLVQESLLSLNQLGLHTGYIERS